MNVTNAESKSLTLLRRVPSCGAPNKENNDSNQTVAIQWKAVISQVAVLFVVSFILGFLVSWVIKSLMAIAVINFTVLITGFTLIHYFTKENKLWHFIHVAVAIWLMSIINVVFGYPFISWLLGFFGIPVLMIIGISISSLIYYPSKKKAAKKRFQKKSTGLFDGMFDSFDNFSESIPLWAAGLALIIIGIIILELK